MTRKYSQAAPARSQVFFRITVALVNLQDIQSSFLFKAMNMRYENVFLEKAVLMTEKNCLLKNLSRELQNRRRKLSSKHSFIFQDSSSVFIWKSDADSKARIFSLGKQ